jgi:hypothetical protein
MTDQEREEFEFRLRLEQEAEADKGMLDKVEDYTGVSTSSPLFGGVTGAVAGIPAGALIEGAARGATAPPPRVGGAGPGTGGEKWARNWAGMNKPGTTVPEAAAAYQRTKGQGPITSKVTQKFGPGAKLDIGSYAQAQKARPLTEKIISRTPESVQRVGRAVAGAGSKIPKWLGRGVAGASAGYQGVDAANRFKQGDYLGGAISGLGALGSGAALIPHPLTRGIGTVVGAGAPFLNELIDRYRRPEEKVSEYAKGGLAHLAGGKKVIEEAASAAKKAFAPKSTSVMRASEALGPHEGKYLYVTESDRMRSTGGDLGGVGFSKFQLEDPRYAEAQAAWGVASKPKASSIININKRFPEDKVIWSPLIGAPEQHRSNQHVYDMLTNEFSRQASRGNLPGGLREAMNQRLSNFTKYAPAKLSGIDVANPEMLKNMGNTFDRRAAIAEVIGGQGVGGRKGQIFDYPGIMQEMTDPMTLGAPTHSVGTRLFSLTGDVEHRPDLHSAFPYILKGEDKGVAFNPVPKELMLGDWISQVKDFTGREPGYMEFMRGVKGGHGKPYQFLDEKTLRKLEAAGHKKGGLV